MTYHTTGTVSITGTYFFNNLATNGGSIFNESGQVTVTASTFEDNWFVAGAWGGAINNASGTVTMINSTIRNLRAGNNGGGIYILR